MFSGTTIAALAVSFLSAVNAHLAISNPVPIPGSNSKSPLDPSGSNFPCQGADLSAGQTTSMAVGSQQPLNWDLGTDGSNWAVHGGGSCQISITYETDAAKLKDPANWKVLHSFIGGCPTNAKLNLDPVARPCTGSNTECVIQDFTFTIPPEVKNGNAIMAWTWFNNIGNREMYMNCAKVSITGASGNLSGLPSMFTANIGNSCATSEGFNTNFPNPGKYVTQDPTFNYPLKAPVGSCGSGAGSASMPSVSPDSGYSSGTSVPTSSPDSGSSSGMPVSSSSPNSGSSSGTSPSYSPAPALSPASASTGSGSVGSGSSSSTTVASQSPSASSSVSNGRRGGRGNGSTGVFGEGALPSSPSSAAQASNNSGSCGSGAVSCSASGFYCIDATHFGECNFGCASPLAMAPGTSCTNNAVAHAVAYKRHANLFATFFSRV